MESTLTLLDENLHIFLNHTWINIALSGLEMIDLYRAF